MDKRTHISQEQPTHCDEAAFLRDRLDGYVPVYPARRNIGSLPPQIANKVIVLDIIVNIVGVARFLPGHARLNGVQVRKFRKAPLELVDKMVELRQWVVPEHVWVTL